MDSTESHSLPQKLRWPKFAWRIELGLAVVSLLFTLVLFFWPELTIRKDLQRLRFIVGLPLASVPVLIPLFVWFARSIAVACRRARQCPVLYQKKRSATDQLDEMKEHLFKILQSTSGDHLFEIARAGYHRGELFIILNKHETAKLDEGDALEALDMKDGRAMGFFKVTEVRDREYYAVGTTNVDPVWLGYVREQRETEINPYLRAIHVPQGGTE